MNEMNEKMIVKVMPAEGSNPEYAPEKELQEGIECHGFVLMTFDEEHDLATALVHNLSIKNICDAVVSNSNEEAVSMIRQAFVIAEGFVKAARIENDHLQDKALKRLKKVMSGMDPDADFMDELPQLFPDDEEQRFPDDE